MIEIKEKIKQICQNINDMEIGGKIGHFLLEYSPIPDYHADFKDIFLDGGWRLVFGNSGNLFDHSYRKHIIERTIEEYELLARKRNEMLELGFMPVGTTGTLFHFKIHIDEDDYFFSYVMNMNEHDWFTGNAVRTKIIPFEGDSITLVHETTNMVAVAVNIFKKLPLDKQLLLPSGMRDML